MSDEQELEQPDDAGDDTGQCRVCGATTIPIAYGLPGAGMWEASDRGEIEFGGCVILDEQPHWRCTGCSATA